MTGDYKFPTKHDLFRRVPRSTRASGAFDCGFKIGDRVSRKDDPRHVGTVLAIISHSVRLRWDGEPAMIGDEYAGDLVKA